MVCPKGFEPLTYALEGRCSIQLSYEHIYIKYLLIKWCVIQESNL